jgi:NAD(P)-dependent dehydrogenase (short-subunit alcohol dehydrogenase family)
MGPPALAGAGSGIGRALAARLAAEGAAVVGCNVNQAGLEGTLAAIREGGGDATLGGRQRERRRPQRRRRLDGRLGTGQPGPAGPRA